jgi:hypothetical protein
MNLTDHKTTEKFPQLLPHYQPLGKPDSLVITTLFNPSLRAQRGNLLNLVADWRDCRVTSFLAMTGGFQ